MHEYSINSDRKSIIAFLAIISSALAGWLNESLAATIPFQIPITFTLFFGILYWFFNAFAWKWFSIIIKTPNLNGIWEGNLKSSYTQFTKELPASIEIVQTWTKICIKGKFNQSSSCSNMASIKLDESGIQIFYAYINETDPEFSTDTMVNHSGYATFNMDLKNKIATGTYFNNPSSRNQNHGKLSLKKES